MSMMRIRIGTSGWQYGHWQGRFYPPGLAPDDWLGHYSARFGTVEADSTFYRLPERTTFERWRERTPDDFILAVKVSRYLTHVKRLLDPADAVKRLLERALGLGPKLGPFLLQLPPTMKADAGRLAETLEAFPSGTRVAVEPRHDSWWAQEVRGVLERRSAALCLADRSGPLTPLWVTADWTYVRFHGGRAWPPSGYGRTALRSWVARLADLEGEVVEAYAYFNNDAWACALRDAVVLGRLAKAQGMAVDRVAAPSEVSPEPGPGRAVGGSEAIGPRGTRARSRPR
jgi:uncharacterized protein YecE (DUF72 family)